MMSHSHALLPRRRRRVGRRGNPFPAHAQPQSRLFPRRRGRRGNPFPPFPPWQCPQRPWLAGGGGANCPWFGSGCSPSLNCDIITAAIISLIISLQLTDVILFNYTYIFHIYKIWTISALKCSQFTWTGRGPWHVLKKPLKHYTYIYPSYIFTYFLAIHSKTLFYSY